jgi:selenocysteine lyase/cysteine desulfurase
VTPGPYHSERDVDHLVAALEAIFRTEGLLEGTAQAAE